jgi:hypothetical protein
MLGARLCRTARSSGLPQRSGSLTLKAMGTKSRESIYGASVRASEERAVEARRKADRLACEAWNKRMMAFRHRMQPNFSADQAP